mmetsp:Transcript_18604/g.43011  ORF Transcript_18604/g.43011 Transcript_18604/m.43011 type:complete len:270 (-) Transcript_18604:980-1789(-)
MRPSGEEPRRAAAAAPLAVAVVVAAAAEGRRSSPSSRSTSIDGLHRPRTRCPVEGNREEGLAAVFGENFPLRRIDEGGCSSWWRFARGYRGLCGGENGASFVVAGDRGSAAPPRSSLFWRERDDAVSSLTPFVRFLVVPVAFPFAVAPVDVAPMVVLAIAIAISDGDNERGDLVVGIVEGESWGLLPVSVEAGKEIIILPLPPPPPPTALRSRHMSSSWRCIRSPTFRKTFAFVAMSCSDFSFPATGSSHSSSSVEASVVVVAASLPWL